MNLPAPRQQPQATPAGQPMPQYPFVVQPTAGDVQLYGERQPVVYVPSAENPNVMVGVLKQHVQPMQPIAARDLTPQPLIDVQAQRLVAAGIGGGVLLWGGGQFLNGVAHVVASFSGVGVFMLCLAAVAARAAFRPGSRAVGGTYNHNEIHVEQKWFGKSGFNIHNN
ncbi:hypothetical protein ACIRLA_22060 [Streptomyces sp. NPDC102364]|uniref:hypothetical protein n=1 Tax=Streptomyces sp. NPDC102364 TaxID=3366161 RepID=UPI00382757ED